MSPAKKNRRKGSTLDRGLKTLGLILVDSEKRKAFVSRLRLVARALISLPSLAYAIILLLGILLSRLVGENNMTLAFLLYLPRSLFLLPALPLLFLVCFVDRRIAGLLAASLLFFAFSGMGWQLRGLPEPTSSTIGESLTVLTYNRGQHANQSLQPFKNETDPDLILLQDARGRAARYAVAPGYEKYTHTLDEGEFTLLSNYPILGSESIKTTINPDALPPAARFEIDFSGTRIALYAVHTISPRDTLLSYRRGAFLWGILGIPGTPFAEKRRVNQEFWDKRIAEARELREIFEADPLPTIVAGDFNAPSQGYIHREFRKSFTDAHMASGSGFGYTFPGTTRNPLSGGGPWMRIDYLFCDDHWEPTWCITERDRPSQHRAVTAQFRFVPDQ